MTAVFDATFVAKSWRSYLFFQKEHVHLLAKGLGDFLQQLLDLQRPLKRDDSRKSGERTGGERSKRVMFALWPAAALLVTDLRRGFVFFLIILVFSHCITRKWCISLLLWGSVSMVTEGKKCTGQRGQGEVRRGIIDAGREETHRCKWKSVYLLWRKLLCARLIRLSL